MMENDEKRTVSVIVPYKNEDGKVFIFLQKRDKDAKRAPGLFGFFGGGRENNETPEETLLRETKEELDFVPNNINYFGKYILPKTIVDVFTTKVGANFENEIKILEGEYGKWFGENNFKNEREFITGDLKILEELYNKL